MMCMIQQSNTVHVLTLSSSISPISSDVGGVLDVCPLFLLTLVAFWSLFTFFFAFFLFFSPRSAVDLADCLSDLVCPLTPTCWSAPTISMVPCHPATLKSAEWSRVAVFPIWAHTGYPGWPPYMRSCSSPANQICSPRRALAAAPDIWWAAHVEE